MKRLILSLAFLSLSGFAFAQKKTDYSIMPSLIKEAKEKGNSKVADSLAQTYTNNYLFKLKRAQLMTKANLSFITENLGTTESKGFKLFFKHRNKINSILGQDKAEYVIRYAITKEFFPKEVEQNSSAVEWGKIEDIITQKFGALGKEVVYGKKMAHYFNVKDWINYGRYYVLYFENALQRPEYYINDMTWYLFENVNDPEVMKFACDVVMKYAMEKWYQTDFNAYDTYANLLYKTGRKYEALDWEEKALKLAKGNEYFEKLYTDNLEKMRNNIVTWKETANK